MPMTLYTQAEYDVLKAEVAHLEARLQVDELLRPLWDVPAHITASALANVWKRLNVTNQTDCMQTLNLVIAAHTKTCT